jgi:hypothetical protein
MAKASKLQLPVIFEFVGFCTASTRLLHPPSAADLYLCRLISLTHVRSNLFKELGFFASRGHVPYQGT